MTSSDSHCQQSYHDVVCIGFGPSAISLGLTLKEKVGNLNCAFLESETQDTWRPLNDLPGHVHMGSNFLFDLVALENPRSDFTFIRYLHQRKLLIDYTNLGLMEPSRKLFEEYLTWCAEHLYDQVRYGTKTLSVEPVYSGSRVISRWNVFTVDRVTNLRHIYTAKRVVFCANQIPVMPSSLSDPALRPMIVHSSQCAEMLKTFTQPQAKDVRIAIVGNSQQAAELFEQLYDIRADRKVTWFVENSELQARADAIVTPNTANSSRDVHLLPLELRTPQNVSDVSHSCVDPSLLKRVNETQYAQMVKQPDSTKWSFKILYNQTITYASKGSHRRVSLRASDVKYNHVAENEFDLVIVATGYARASLRPMLDSFAKGRLLDGPDVTVNAQYEVNLRRGITEAGTGLWYIGLVGDMETAVGEGALHITAERSATVAASLIRTFDQTEHASTGVQRTIQAQL